MSVLVFHKVHGSSMAVAYTWYDQAEKVETNGTDSHMSIHEESQYAHTIE